jgi:hypothetical protein
MMSAHEQITHPDVPSIKSLSFVVQYKQMNPDQNNNEPKIIQPQWQYTSGNLSQNQPLSTPNTISDQPANPEVDTINQPEQNADNDAVISTPQENQNPQSLISWRASEFASSDKNGSWYILLAIGSIIFSAVTYLLTKQLFSVIVILILGITVAFYGKLKPRVLDYSIDTNGIFVGNKYYLFTQFKSFSIIEDQAIPSIHLMPIKKLMMPITIYIAPEAADNIIEILGNILPFEDRKRDIADKISQKLRF